MDSGRAEKGVSDSRFTMTLRGQVAYVNYSKYQTSPFMERAGHVQIELPGGHEVRSLGRTQFRYASVSALIIA